MSSVRPLATTASRRDALAEFGLRPVQSGSLSEQIADQIVEAIGSGRILPGQRLFEVELAGQLSVSRVPVREALLVLQSQGVLRTTPRRGTHVVDLDESWAREIYEARTALETLCFERAAATIRNNPVILEMVDARLEAIRTACDARDKCAINRSDLAFHTLIYQLADSPLLQTLWNAMSRHVMIMFGLETFRLTHLDELISEHEMLRELLLKGSSREMAAAIASHVIGSLDAKEIEARAYHLTAEPIKKSQSGGSKT